MDKLVASFNTAQAIHINRTIENGDGLGVPINHGDASDGWQDSTSVGWKGGPSIGGPIGSVPTGSIMQIQGGPSPTDFFPVMRFNNPSGSNKLYLASVQTWASTFSGVTASTAGSLLIFDRIACWRNILAPSFSGGFILPVGARSYNSGVGVRCAYESITRVTSGSSATRITYTNSEGGGGRVSPFRAISGGVNAYNFSELPLMAGDRGVRSIESATGGAGSTAMLTLYRPLARVPVSVHGNRMDFTELGLPEILPNCGLSVAWVGNTGTITPNWGCVLTLVEG